jgi:hypothetical protein
MICFGAGGVIVCVIGSCGGVYVGVWNIWGGMFTWMICGVGAGVLM